MLWDRQRPISFHTCIHAIVRRGPLARFITVIFFVSFASALGAFGLQQNVIQLEGYVIDGHSDRPLANVVVEVEGKKTRSDVDGRFSFAELEPVTYLLIAEKDGYSRARAAEGRIPGTSGIVVTLAAGPVSKITMRMFPAGVVSGKIVDSTGKPIRGMTVAPYRYTYDGRG